MRERKWMVVLTASAMLLAWQSSQAQTVYKWVDAGGKTHYGSQPPNSQEAETMKLQGSKANSMQATKKIPKETQELARGMEAELKKVDAKTVPLSCATAVDNVQSQISTMLETGQRNVQQGYVKSSDFEGVASKLRIAKSQTTVADCESATGNKKLFYQCMSSDRNHAVGCGTKYKY